MNNRDNQLWLQLWRDKSIDFHQKATNTLLTRFWPKLNPGKKSKVFVPLCGKSLDMLWLAEQGHEVIGVELSPIAVRDFYKENGLKASKKEHGKFILWQHENISILCGDYFSLTKDDLGEFDIIYDRASLTALPEDIRKDYVAHLKIIAKNTNKIFLLTTEDATEQETMQQALGVGDEINSLYANNFDIELIHVDSVYESAPQSNNQTLVRAEYKLYQLSAKPDVNV